uniref:Uncharacterized protein n=1 Tax=Salix viminalis TaxID=40686 RepID=A0A6N2MV79_SALVM
MLFANVFHLQERHESMRVVSEQRVLFRVWKGNPIHQGKHHCLQPEHLEVACLCAKNLGIDGDDLQPSPVQWEWSL